MRYSVNSLRVMRFLMPITVNEGDIHTVADVPQNVTTDEGTYTFDGWYNGKDKVGTTIAVTSDVTLTGVWTFEGKDDVWNTVYGTIRVYMDEEIKAGFRCIRRKSCQTGSSLQREISYRWISFVWI